MSTNTVQEVMVGLGTFEERMVYASRKHPQVGYIQYEGKRQKVCIGFWQDEPVWKLVDDEQEYAHCAQKTMRIADDPDYCGTDSTKHDVDLRSPLQNYMQEVLRTYAGSGTQMDKFTLGALGLAGESGEVVDIIKKMLYQGHRLDFMKLLEEVGDVLWYIALICDALEVTLDDAIELNIQKLHQRYPNGFESARSINRSHEEM